jgi:hypothetical protein
VQTSAESHLSRTVKFTQMRSEQGPWLWCRPSGRRRSCLRCAQHGSDAARAGRRSGGMQQIRAQALALTASSCCARINGQAKQITHSRRTPPATHRNGPCRRPQSDDDGAGLGTPGSPPPHCATHRARSGIGIMVAPTLCGNPVAAGTSVGRRPTNTARLGYLFAELPPGPEVVG